MTKRVLGPKGQNLKLIAALSHGARIRLRGEGFQERDFQNPLQVNLSAPGRSEFVLARSMVMRLLRQIYADWTEYTGEKHSESSGIRLLDHPMNPEDASDEAAAFRKVGGRFRGGLSARRQPAFGQGMVLVREVILVPRLARPPTPAP